MHHNIWEWFVCEGRSCCFFELYNISQSQYFSELEHWRSQQSKGASELELGCMCVWGGGGGCNSHIPCYHIVINDFIK